MDLEPTNADRPPIVPRRAKIGLFALLAIMMALAVFSRDTLADQASVILTVDGRIDTSRYPNGAAFDRDALFALGSEKLETETHFTKGMQSFEGVRLAVLLEAVGANGTVLTATGLDGYSVDIPMEDATRFSVFLAMKWNGAVMKVRNKGPVWIVYPISRFPETNTEIHSARAVWQLKTLTVR
jgi:hypothetical protein